MPNSDIIISISYTSKARFQKQQYAIVFIE